MDNAERLVNLGPLGNIAGTPAAVQSPPIQFRESPEEGIEQFGENKLNWTGESIPNSHWVNTVAQGPRGIYRVRQNAVGKFEAYHTVHGKREEYLGSHNTRSGAMGLANRHYTTTKHLPV